MQNLEYKAELRDPDVARAALRRLGAAPVGTVRQVDTYFRIHSGRLKKRETTFDGADEPVEIIHYERHDRAQPKLSKFSIYTEEQAAERFGTLPLPIWVRVAKTREIFMKGGVRIHLDEVDDLGRFIEFEALVTKTQNVARCHEVLAELRTALGPTMGEPISVSYSDLIADRQQTDTTHP